MKKLINMKEEIDAGAEISDGYHTFGQLYDHRVALYIALCKWMSSWRAHGLLRPSRYRVWRSKAHADGSSWDGWFIMGIGTKPGEQITYHLPLKDWDKTDFAHTHDVAPCAFDGHTPEDVLKRLEAL